jgi:predicted nucleotidyltransferase
MPRMGMIRSAATGLAGALLSRVQLRVLHLLIGNPDRNFHASEIIRLAESGSGAVQRELKKLAAAGIVTVTSSGNRKLYQANRQSPIFEELYGIVVKTVGLIEPLKRALKPFASKIMFAFVYGSIAKGMDTAKSDVDLMILGADLSYSDVFGALQKAERRLLRSVSPTLMTVQEWKQKLERGNSFVANILRQPKIFIAGTDDELQGIGQSR